MISYCATGKYEWKARTSIKGNAKKYSICQFNRNFEVLSTYENSDTVAAELKISVNSEEQLYVVDVITINAEGTIGSISSYFGRGTDN